MLHLRVFFVANIAITRFLGWNFWQKFGRNSQKKLATGASAHSHQQPSYERTSFCHWDDISGRVSQTFQLSKISKTVRNEKKSRFSIFLKSSKIGFVKNCQKLLMGSPVGQASPVAMSATAGIRFQVGPTG